MTISVLIEPRTEDFAYKKASLNLLWKFILTILFGVEIEEENGGK